MDPPATQITETPPGIFVNSDGSPIPIFAEAGHILARPVLVRRLKRFGATICTDPKNAQIILVNPESTQGRLFVRNWGHDTNKVVLDSAWAKKCFDEQKVLLEDDDYGGYLIIDDGRPINTDDDEESEDEVRKSPLPTPRATPVEPLVTRAKTSKRPSFSANEPSPVASPPMSNSGPSMNPETPAVTPLTFNGMDMAAMAQFMQQFAATTALSQNPQMPLGMLPQQPAMMQMFPPGFPFSMPQQNMQNDPFWLAVRDTMMNKGLYPSHAQPPPSQLPHNIFAQQVTASPVQQQVLPFPPIPSANGSPSQNADSAQSSVKAKGKNRAVSPSAKRRKISSNSFQVGSRNVSTSSIQETASKSLYSTSILEGSSSSNSANAPKANGSSMGPPGERKVFKTRSGREITFYVQVGGHNRFGLVQSIKKNGGAIVSNITEADYAILYQTPGSRADKIHESFLHQAQAEGVPAVHARFVTECLEANSLLDAEPYLFETSKNKLKRAARTASPMSPESEDDEQGQSEPQQQQSPQQASNGHTHEQKQIPQEYPRLKINIPAQNREKPTSSTSQYPITNGNGSILDQVDQSPPKRKRGRPRLAPRPLTVETVHIRPKPKPVSSWHNGPPSPPAPGLYSVVPWGNGYKFSHDENDFAIDYAKVLIERNHEISLNLIATAIHRKLPHHTLKSWRTHLATLYGDDLDEWRKRAGIAFRKANAKNGSSTPVPSSSTPTAVHWSQMSDAEEPPPSARVSTVSVSPMPEPTVRRATNKVILSALEADLVAISRFFAEGNDDQTETEEVIWAKLSAQDTCNTESSWESFYQKHSDEVQRRYQTLLDMQESNANA